MEENSSSSTNPAWQNCSHCPSLVFSTAAEFERHILDKHSIKEGTIILCQYGQNGMCSALQFGDLRKAGFKYHIREYHTYTRTPNESWTFYSSSQNLPAVLNDPNRGKQSNFFTKTWGDSFVDKIDILPSPYLPDVTLTHFESYCKKIAKRYRRHLRLKENLPVKNKTAIIENDCEIPDIFYEPGLPLNDPVVFSKVFPNLCSSVDNDVAIRSLQETLSTYLDVIEMNISKQVAQRSDAFFHAMLSHDTIMEQMAKAVNTVQKTRKHINQVKKNLTECPLKLKSLTRINCNLGHVHEILKLMSTVQQTQPMIQLLLSTSDYVAALDLIGSTQKVLSTRLTGIQAFRHLSPQLTEMKRLIHKMLSNEFLKFIVCDLNRPLIDESDIPEKDKIISIVSGILRLKEFDFLDTFKMEAMTSIQATIKQSVIEIISQRDGCFEIVLRGSNADNMWLLCNEGILFLQKVTPNLVMLFKRILSLTNLIIDVSQMEDVNGSDNEEIWSAEELTSIEDKLKKMIVSLSDYCNERCANLIVTKTDKDYVCSDMSQLSLLSNLIKEFCTKCEDVTGYCSNAMNLALRSFAMKYIQTLHTERRSQLTASLNAERWKTADVPYELQSAITKICEIQEIPPNLLYESGKPDGKYLFINKESYALVILWFLPMIKQLLEKIHSSEVSLSGFVAIESDIASHKQEIENKICLIN